MNSSKITHSAIAYLKGIPLLENLSRALYQVVEDVIQGDTLLANEALRNSYLGERCFIICTGASLRDIDLSLLQGKFTFGTGHLHSPHLDYWVRRGLRTLDERFRAARPSVDLTFYAIIDPIWPLVYNNGAVYYFLDFCRSAHESFGDPQTVFFLHGASRRFVQRHGLFPGRRVHYVKSAGPTTGASMHSNDLTKRMSFMDGSIFFMIAAAMFMGFRELYLCGCDYTFKPRRSGHYYEDWTLMSDEPVEITHTLLKRFADERGVKVYNVVPDAFESPVYDKVTWAEVVENVLQHETVAVKKQS